MNIIWGTAGSEIICMHVQDQEEVKAVLRIMEAKGWKDRFQVAPRDM